jgi:hypothetical protein
MLVLRSDMTYSHHNALTCCPSRCTVGSPAVSSALSIMASPICTYGTVKAPSTRSREWPSGAAKIPPTGTLVAVGAKEGAPTRSHICRQAAEQGSTLLNK